MTWPKGAGRKHSYARPTIIRTRLDARVQVSVFSGKSVSASAPFSALGSFRPETVIDVSSEKGNDASGLSAGTAVMASFWMVRLSLRAEAMDLSRFWTATAPLSSVWADVASVADPAQESSQPFRATSSRERRAKKDGNSAPAAKACASTPKVALSCASRGRSALGKRISFSESARETALAYMAAKWHVRRLEKDSKGRAVLVLSDGQKIVDEGQRQFERPAASRQQEQERGR